MSEQQSKTAKYEWSFEISNHLPVIRSALRCQSGKNPLRQSFKSPELRLRTSASMQFSLILLQHKELRGTSFGNARVIKMKRIQELPNWHLSFFFCKLSKAICPSSKTRRRKKSSNLHVAPRTEFLFSQLILISYYFQTKQGAEVT